MVIVITQQPQPLLTHDDDIVRQSLGLDGTDKDLLVDGLLMAAQAELDGPLGWVGISVAQQSVQLTAVSFDCPIIRLPGGPIIGDIDVTYLASDGSSLTLDPVNYVLAPDGSITLVSGSQWPTPIVQSNAITVDYDVGIEDEDDPRIKLMQTAIILHAKMTLDHDDVDTRRRTIEALVRPLWVPVL